MVLNYQNVMIPLILLLKLYIIWYVV